MMQTNDIGSRRRRSAVEMGPKGDGRLEKAPTQETAIVSGPLWCLENSITGKLEFDAIELGAS
jgi:hypothetical protein